jgi:hypothetical protein
MSIKGFPPSSVGELSSGQMVELKDLSAEDFEDFACFWVKAAKEFHVLPRSTAGPNVPRNGDAVLACLN